MRRFDLLRQILVTHVFDSTQIPSILTPLVGNNEHSVKNTKELVGKLQNLEIPPGQKLLSYDVTALFTSVPVDKALTIINERLHDDPTLSNRTELNTNQISELLDLCLTTTYFIYDGTYYQQPHGAAMGSPISPVVANLYMEHFEHLALSTAPHPPSLSLRYVDDTYVRIHEYDVEGFTRHINTIDDNIKFTIEPETNSKLPFLDLCTHILDDGSTKLTIYRKPTHTDQYLNFKSHHPLVHKRSVVRTLTTRAQEYVTNQTDKKAEPVHVRATLRANDYPEWALEVPRPSKPRAKNTAGPSGSNTRRPMLGVPYVAGLSEQLGRVYKAKNIYMYHKPANTLRSKVVHPKDKTPSENKCGTIYHITCDNDPNHRESKRPPGVRFKEHLNLDKPTGVGEHCLATGHSVSNKNIRVLSREQEWHKRKVKEAIYIKQHGPTMNRDQGYQLPPIYTEILPPVYGSSQRHA